MAPKEPAPVVADGDNDEYATKQDGGPSVNLARLTFE